MTKIFDSYLEFLGREDNTENGVDADFAAAHPRWQEENDTNQASWNCSGCSGCSRCSDCSDCSGCSGCSRCSGCSDCSGCSGCSDCSGCSGCSGCSRCSDCSDCSRCSGCSGCSDCSRCSDCSGCSGLRWKDAEKDVKIETVENKILGFPPIPVIENIHQKVNEAVGNPGALDMSTWHTCDTTHCRAGWVVFLAGGPGKILENHTSTEFAAMQIYKVSSDIRVSPTRFYEKNEPALADIIRCAEEEAKIKSTE